jgi:hypothetical protein
MEVVHHDFRDEARRLLVSRERLRVRIASQDPHGDEQCLCFMPNEGTAFFPIACRVHAGEWK